MKISYIQIAAKTDKKLKEIIKSDLPLLQDIRQYVISSGGKRIRPIFLYLLTKMNGYQGNLHVDAGAIAELIHAASLLHDDVIDNADIRRGKYTVGKLYGNKVAILAGDHLLTSAIEHLGKMGNMEILNLFNTTIREITRSELIQMQWEKNPAIKLKTYQEIIYGKTASLFGAVAESAAILCGLDTTQQKSTRAFGVGIGNLFQIKDDYIDYFLPVEKTGKINMKDFLNGLVTHPMILLLSSLQSKEKKAVVAMFAKASRNMEDMTNIQELMKKYKIAEKIQKQMKKESLNLLNYLNSYPETQMREAMKSQVEKLGMDLV